MITARDLQGTLEELGYDVPEVASSGAEALNLAAALLPDIALMDIKLGTSPRDGIEIAHDLRRKLGVPVIYLSAYADPAILRRASATAPLGYLTKPFERRALHATIEMALVKQRQERLHHPAKEVWSSASLTSIGDGVIATDSRGIVKFLNPAAQTLTGWTQASAFGQALDDVFALFDPETHRPRFALAARVIAKGTPGSGGHPVLLRQRSGAMIPVEKNASPIHDQRDGSLLGVIVVFRDQRERPHLDRARDRARQFENLELLSSGIAHDLHNLLAVIAGNVSLADNAQAPEQAHEHTRARIQEAVVRAQSLTGQFLAFSKDTVPVRRETDFGDLLAGEVNRLCQSVRQILPRVKWRLEIAPGLWSGKADESQIRRALENLLRNALQALPADGGEIIARARNCTRAQLPARLLAPAPGHSGEPASHFVQLEISDTGCGIPASSLPHVCDPYFTTRPAASGLGLSVCLSIASKHAGFLSVESQAGSGATATIYLPANAPSPEARPRLLETPPKPRTRDAGAGALRVLVMDDEPLMCQLLAIMLGSLGHRAVTAQTGEEALRLYDEAASDDPFDIVCIDLVNKLGMGGQEMMALLRERHPDAVGLACSGYAQHPAMTDFKAHGFSGRLTKPFDLESLELGLRQTVLSSGRPPRG